MTIIVDVSDPLVKTFTEEDKKTYESCVPKEAWPSLYGEDLDNRLLYKGTSLIDIADISSGSWKSTQGARVGGKNTKYPAIRRNITRNGFKLIYPAIALLYVDGEFYVITGNTRLEILDFLGMENVIVSIYEPNPKYSNKEVMDAYSQAGIKFNTIHDEASTTSQEDVKRETEHAITEGWIKPTLSEITTRVETMCGQGVFTPTRRHELIYEILNNHDPAREVKSWGNPSARALQMKKMKLMNGNGIKYLLWTTENKPKVFIRALEEASKFNGEIRVILHTGTLSGYDLEKTYNDRISSFLDFWTATESKIERCYNVSLDRSKSNIRLYGVFPSLSDIHDLDKLVFIDSDGSLFQKGWKGEFEKKVVS